jgi:hypothetical protein
MSSYTDPILTKQGYRSLGTNSDFFMNLSVDTPTKGNLLMFDGLNWKPTATENINFGTIIFDGGNASGLGHAYLSVI